MEEPIGKKGGFEFVGVEVFGSGDIRIVATKMAPVSVPQSVFNFLYGVFELDLVNGKRSGTNKKEVGDIFGSVVSSKVVSGVFVPCGRVPTISDN